MNQTTTQLERILENGWKYSYSLRPFGEIDVYKKDTKRLFYDAEEDVILSGYDTKGEEE